MVSGLLDAQDKVCLGVLPLKLLHPRNEFRQTRMVIAEHAVLAKLDSAEIDSSDNMRFFSICGYLLNPLILFFRLLILHSGEPPVRVIVLWVERFPEY